LKLQSETNGNGWTEDSLILWHSVNFGWDGVYGFPRYTWHNLFDYFRPICLAVLQSDNKATEYVQTHAFKILRTCQSLHGFQSGAVCNSPHFSLDSCNYNCVQRATVTYSGL